MVHRTPISRVQGFTLIEILIVIGLIGVLAAIVLVAINPAKQFEDANNAQRTSNVNAILNAIGQYVVDNRGNLDGLDIPSGQSNTATISSAGADICEDLVPEYLAALPADPSEDNPTITEDECDSYTTGYSIYKDNGRVTVSAPGTEGDGDDISVTR